MAPLKPLVNFKFKLFIFPVLVDPSNSKSIVAETNILLPPSLELQDGSNKSLFTTRVSSFYIIVGAKIPISFDFDLIVPKPKKAKKVG
jgi:hypothetical protein